MQKIQLKITYDPYKKEIKYQRIENDGNKAGEWGSIGDKSPLSKNEKYQKATIQHNIFEIIKEVDKEFNRGGAGIEITFEGTDEDYNDVEEAVSQFVQMQKEQGKEKDIKCKKGDRYLASASEVMPNIESEFKRLKKVFENYDEPELKKELERYEDASQTEVPVCVIGTYSTGKSAVINALIGEEVLPSADNPTTARIHKIVATEKKGRIIFKNRKKEIRLIFEGDKFNREGDIESELNNKISKKIEENKGKNLYQNMYWALSAINEYANEKKDADKKEDAAIDNMIKVEVPFRESKLINQGFKVVIYDTPGSNSKSYQEHCEVLRNALSEQTNGLPIVLTTPDSMDSTDAGGLINILSDMGTSLDSDNAMVIVNKADEKEMGPLKESVADAKKAVLLEWKPNRLYFLSAIVGLAGKKVSYGEDSDWVDRNYYGIFDDKKDSFVNEKKVRYKELYKCNRIAENQKNSYIKSIKSASSERELLRINSGLDCIEKEIAIFAKRYALYNKCEEAQKSLEKAIDLTRKEIKKKEKELEEENNLIVELSDDKKKDIKNKLSDTIKTMGKCCVDEYPKLMKKETELEQEDYHLWTENRTEELWKHIKQEKTENRVKTFLDEFEKELSDKRGEIVKNKKEKSTDYWKGKSDEIQKKCCNIITDHSGLTREEKRKLQEAVMDCKLEIDSEVHIQEKEEEISRHFLWFKFDSIKVKKVGEELYKNYINLYIRQVNAVVIEIYENEFKSWNKRLENMLVQRMAELNPELKEYGERMGKLQDELKTLRAQERELENALSRIKEAFRFKMCQK